MHKDEPVLSTDPTSPLKVRMAELSNTGSHSWHSCTLLHLGFPATDQYKGKNLLSIVQSFSQISFLLSSKQETKCKTSQVKWTEHAEDPWCKLRKKGRSGSAWLTSRLFHALIYHHRKGCKVRQQHTLSCGPKKILSLEQELQNLLSQPSQNIDRENYKRNKLPILKILKDNFSRCPCKVSLECYTCPAT